MKAWLVIVFLNGTHHVPVWKQVDFVACASGIAAQETVIEIMKQHPTYLWDKTWKCVLGTKQQEA